jgi:hypothetical protein
MDDRALLIVDDLAFLNARAMYPDAIVIPVSVQARIVATARADALREAAERVRGLAPPLDFDDEERVCDSIFTDKQEGQ